MSWRNLAAKKKGKQGARKYVDLYLEVSNRDDAGFRGELESGKETMNSIEDRDSRPECNVPLIEREVRIVSPQGVGQTYSQHMRPWFVPTEFVCPKCGFVGRQSVREVHR